MKVLVATRQTNGSIDGDFTFCTEGELVTIDGPCGRDRRDPAGGCGCGRSFSGLHSHRATTTAVVTDLPLTGPQVREAVRSSREQGGWMDPSFCSPELAMAMVEEGLARVGRVADHFAAAADQSQTMQTLPPLPASATR